MKKILILLALTFTITILVACSEAEESSNNPNGLKIGDTGTVKATKKSNDAWQFDYTDLGVSDSQVFRLEAIYYSGYVHLANVDVHKDKPFDKYVWDVRWADIEAGDSLNAVLDIPSGANALKPLIPADTGFVFADNDTTFVNIFVDIDGK